MTLMVPALCPVDLRTRMTHIVAVRGALPPYRYSQAEIAEAVAAMMPDGTRRGVVDRLHANAGVSFRHFALPLDRYAKLDDFGMANDTFLATAVELGAEAVDEALDAAGLTARDVDLLVFTSVTGIGAPSVDARLVGRLGLRRDVKRIPIFGLGCVAGAAGVARLHDYLRGWPGDVAVLLSVELCSLTVQRDDGSAANLVAGALFGDGAAAVVACGERRVAELPTAAGPRVLATRSSLYPDTEHVMGWDIGGHGFRVVLDASVPEVVRGHLRDDVSDFLADHGLTPSDIGTWVCHTGGPKVLEAIADALGLPDGALALSWRSLAELGNLSSASVLHVLRDTMAEPPAAGGYGLMLAMGPGVSAEMVLVRW